MNNKGADQIVRMRWLVCTLVFDCFCISDLRYNRSRFRENAGHISCRVELIALVFSWFRIILRNIENEHVVNHLLHILFTILNVTSNVTDRVFAIFSKLCKKFKPKFQGSAKNI